MKPLVVITPRGFHSYGQDLVSQLEESGWRVDVNDTGKTLSRETFLKKCQDATALVVGTDTCDHQFFDIANQLKLIIKFGVGTDNINLERASKEAVKVERCIGTNANAVAELTLGLIFSLCRKLPNRIMDVRNHQWNKTTGIELTGKTIGILGYGRIGQRVGAIAKAIGMNVLSYDINSPYPLTELLPKCDFISIHMPLTKETENLIDQKEFQLMKPSCFLINTARGGIVNEEALLDALQTKQIAGAAFDVFTSEPAKGEIFEQLIKLEQFYLTPHIASRTEQAERNTAQMATKYLLDFIK